MKILAIAGKNLASLTQFELRLDTAPLDREGLFAITGPTGAGKSTILDAMCVSLYDRMPRLPRSKTKLSEEEGNPFTNLTLSDPRHIMRRGAKSCFAETTFLGVDGDRYKARWEVPATQRKNAKSLKKPVISLENLDQDVLFVDKKRDIQELILKKVGLTFEQFCRSVFLAQGDFAAFLKADGDARAELLERMTGTEIYRDLSLAAFERAKSEREALEQLQNQMSARDVLTPEARAELDSTIAETEEKRNAAQAAWQECQRLVLGFEKRQQLQQALVEAKANLIIANQAKEHQVETQKALDTWEKLGEGRDAWVNQNRLRTQLKTKEVQKSELAAALPQKEARVSELEKSLAESKRAWSAHEQRIANQKPFLDEARKCDIHLENAATQKLRLLEQQQAQQIQVEKQQNLAETHRQAVEHWQTQLQEASLNLKALFAFEPLALQGKTWQQDLSQFLNLANEIRTATVAQAKHLWNLGEFETRTALVEKALTKSEAGYQALSHQVEGFDRADFAQKQTQWSEKFQTHQHQGRALEKLQEIQFQVTELQKRLAEVISQQSTLREGREMRAQHMSQLQMDITRIGAQQQEAKDNLERVLLASSESAKIMRSQLEPGKPCPVCGATQHPNREDTGFDPLIQQSRKRVNTLERDWAEKRAQFAQMERDQAYVQDQFEQLEQEMKANNELQSRYRNEAESWVGDFPQLANTSPGRDGFSMTLSVLAESWERARTSLDAEKAELQQQEQQRTVLRASMAIASQHLQKLRETHRQMGESRAEAQYQLELARNQCADRSQAITHLTQRLNQTMEHFPQWRQDLIAQRYGFIESLKAPVHRLEQAKQILNQAETAEKQILPELATAQEAASQAQAQFTAIVDQAHIAEQTWQTLQEQRLQLLGGRSVKEIEAENTSQTAQLRETLDVQTEARETAQTHLRKAQAALQELEHAVAHINTELARCDATLQQVLQANEFDLETVRPLLEKDATWAQEQRQLLQEVLADWNRAQGSLKSAEDQLETHLESFQHDGELAQAVTNRDKAQSDKELLETAFARVAMQRETDDRARAELGTLQTAYDDQARRWELWDSMRELIGSHDGKKFRIYAQSLTLDMLLHHANHHLKDLARRYQLERLPGADLALRIVDRDMGDEIRSVNSLSGGETFLVSLALALGLATFATSQTPIESLFIDEGFGSLDAESLEIALDTLEALQAMGRQVGVISHVQTLVERIAAQVQVRKVGGGHSEVRIRFRH